MDTAERRTRVVIVGGGFAGLQVARLLGRRKDVSLTMVDRRNHHLFQPLLYQVATATLEASSISMPLRALLGRHPRTEVLLAEATGIDAARKRLLLADGEVPYDFLVLTTGATHSYFGHDEWSEHTLALKTAEDALEMRRRVLVAFEAAERETDPAARARLLTFVIIGGGPTGVELAGALAEVARHTLAGEFKHFNPRDTRILLLEGLGRILPTYPEELSEKAKATLERLGVEVRVGARVTAIDADGVSVGEQRIRSATVVWAAGVAASPLPKSLGAPLDRAGRVRVTDALTVPGHPDVYVAGDLASFEQEGKPVPGIAPAALQMGKHVAKNIRRAMKGEPLRPFRYFDKGYFAVIGRGHAVGVALGRKASGFLAWLGWLFIHILYLVGFRSRAVVLLNWAYSYFTWRRGVRTITGVPTVLVHKSLPAESSVMVTAESPTMEISAEAERLGP